MRDACTESDNEEGGREDDDDDDLQAGGDVSGGSVLRMGERVRELIPVR